MSSEPLIAEAVTTSAWPGVNSEQELADESTGKLKRDISLGSLALVDQMVVSATNFTTMWLLAQLFSTAEMGLFGLAWTIFGFERTTQERLLSAPYIVFAHRPGQRARRWLGSSLAFQVSFGIVCSLIIWAAAGIFWALGTPAGLPSVLACLGVGATFLLMRDHIRAVCSAHFRYDLSLLLNIGVSTIQLGGIFLFYGAGWLSMHAVMMVLGFACFVPSAVWLWLRRRTFRVDKRRLASDWNTSWTYSRWLVGARAVGIGGFYMVPWIVAYHLDEAAVGSFTICNNLVGLSLMFILGMNNFFTPRSIKAYQHDGADGLLRSVLETVAVFAFVLGIVAVTMFFFGGQLLEVVYGPNYAGNGLVVFYLSLSMLAVSVSIAWGNGLAALGKPRGYFAGELAYCIVAIGLAWTMIPRMHLSGAALALFGAGVTVALVTGSVFFRLLNQCPSIDQRLETGGDR